MPTSDDLAFFRHLLRFELRCAKRYRRFLSLVLVGNGNGPVPYWELLGETVRDSDEFAEIDEDVAILMGETDQSAAIRAVERYKMKCEGVVDLRFSIASYPKDKPFEDVLLRLARKRLHRARMAEAGAVVYEG